MCKKYYDIYMCVFYEGKKYLRILNIIIEMKFIKYKKKYREKNIEKKIIDGFFINLIDVYNDIVMLWILNLLDGSCKYNI